MQPMPESYSQLKFGKKKHEGGSDVYGSDEDDNFTGVAQNLLGIRDTMRWDSGSFGGQSLPSDDHCEPKGESSFSITKLFEPKFMEVFGKFCDYTHQTIDLSQHLMSLCLDNLIPFCCWARENNNRNAWIRQVLDDNLDLRPEVRNGLSMILIYVLSTAKATQFADVDMFGILQDNDTGLGIVNKTSLKIYNDPYNYFNFLKSCMSGLIDAGKVPENERQNQPKKTKKLTENKEELMAYLQLKTALVGMFNRGDHLVARSNIQHVSHVWQQRHKNIRNRRFATAVAIMSAPPPPALVAQFDGNTTGLSRISLPYAEDYSSAAGTAKYSILPHYPPVNNNTNASGSPHVPPMLHTYPPVSVMPQAQLGERSELPGGLNSLAAVSAGVLDRGNNVIVDSASQSPLPIYASSSSSLVLPTGVTGAPRLHSTMSSNSTLSAALMPSQLQIPSEPFFPQQMNKSFRSSLGGTPHGVLFSGGLNQIAGRSFPSIPAMRFERVGAKEWECKESKIYNIESLVLHNSSVFCLVDEARLSAEERAQKKIKSQSTGFVSLHAELQQRGALVTSWPKSDHSHMLDFLESWLAQNPSLSMVDYWHGNHVDSPGVSPNGSSSSGNNVMSCRGTIAYEVVLQVGIVVRKNEALGISEDCWRLIYPQDLEAETLTVTLGAFLASFFPQLRSVFAKLSSGAGGSDLGNVVVKYFPHKIEPPVTQAPRSEALTAYQTIGTLDEPSNRVLAR